MTSSCSPTVLTISPEAYQLSQVLHGYTRVDVTPQLVESWSRRFALNPLQRTRFLEALAYMFRQTYVTKDEYVAYAQSILGWDWSPAGMLGQGVSYIFFTGHNPGQSAYLIREIMDEHAHKQGMDPLLWLSEGMVYGKRPVYVYVDDVFCTGHTFASAVKSLPAAAMRSPIRGEFLHGYASNRAYTLSMLRSKGYRDVAIHARHDDPSWQLRPRWCSEYAESRELRDLKDRFPGCFSWRGAPVSNDTIFRCQSDRNLVEGALFEEGLRTRNRTVHRGDWPMGHQALVGVGFGATSVTYRNCPNNAPLAFHRPRGNYPELFTRAG